MWWPKTARQRELIDLASALAAQCAARAEQHDRDGTFPPESFAELHRSGYLALSIPREFGGGGASLLELALAQERLARGDGSVALGAAMHLSILGRLGQAVLAGDAADMGGWDRERYTRVARAVVEEGALINSAASEPETGSPSRGGRPATVAQPLPGGGFTITGRKTYTTMAPALRFILVSATIEAETGPEAAQFLLNGSLPGLRIEETWDTMGMRASGSHDLVLDDVRVGPKALLSRRRYGAPVEPSAVLVAPAAATPPVAVAGKALRVVGGAGLARSHPVQRYYRDVRAGLHHPPMDDVALSTLAKAAMEKGRIVAA